MTKQKYKSGLIEVDGTIASANSIVNISKIISDYHATSKYFTTAGIKATQAAYTRNPSVAKQALEASYQARILCHAAKKLYQEVSIAAIEEASTLAQIAHALKKINDAIDPFEAAAKIAQQKAIEATRKAIEAEESAISSQPK